MLGSLQINSSALFTGKIFILSRGVWCLRERQSAEGHIEYILLHPQFITPVEHLQVYYYYYYYHPVSPFEYTAKIIEVTVVLIWR